MVYVMCSSYAQYTRAAEKVRNTNAQHECARLHNENGARLDSGPSQRERETEMPNETCSRTYLYGPLVGAVGTRDLIRKPEPLVHTFAHLPENSFVFYSQARVNFTRAQRNATHATPYHSSIAQA